MSDMNNGIPSEQPLATQGSEGTVVNNAPVVQDTQVTQPTQPEVTPVSEYEIDGIGKVKIDDIKEWQRGYMRQSDYTRKTQEVAKSRKETQEAMEVYNYLKSNPQIVEALSSGDTSVVKGNPAFKSLNPMDSRIDELNFKLASIELDSNLDSLKRKYPDFNEVEVLTEAERLNLSDLEFVYQALQGRKLPDIESKIRKDVELQLTNKIRQNGLDTSTVIEENDVPTGSANHGLTAEEILVASKMGISPERYAKNKMR